MTATTERERPPRAAPVPRVGRRRHLSKRLALFVVALAAVSVVVVPLYFGVIGGFKDNAQLNRNPLGIPSPWNVSHYTDVLQNGDFWRQALNSTFIAAATVVLTVGVAALAAYMFARFAFRGREVLFMLFAAGLMFPPAVAILPLFVLLRQLGLLTSPWGVVLPQAAYALPITIIILRTFFRGIPAEIEESAILDGCSTFGVFWRIMLPMARPALAVVSVLTLVTSWNNFLLPLVVLIRDQSLWTLPLGVMQFQGQFANEVGRVLAYTMLALVPALVFFFAAERQIVAGIAPSAGTKG
jgi:raffinose/stachyose/melibiose transport system permease protein